MTQQQSDAFVAWIQFLDKKLDLVLLKGDMILMQLRGSPESQEIRQVTADINAMRQSMKHAVEAATPVPVPTVR